MPYFYRVSYSIKSFDENATHFRRRSFFNFVLNFYKKNAGNVRHAKSNF